ncbi:hypothetical protein EBAG_03626 [Escherichia coli T426]|nr:hypothetical protein EBAG_03626 [Escherichia coli T426]
MFILLFFYVMNVTLIVAARFVHIYNHIFNSCLK